MKTKSSAVIRRITLFQWILPPLIFLIVFFYEAVVVPFLGEAFNLQNSLLAETFFYGIIGPLIAYLTLAWFRHWVIEKERIEQKIMGYEKHIASLKVQEGRRVAQNLHREVLSNLAYLAIRIDHTRSKLLESSYEDTNEELLQTASQLRETIDELSRKIKTLRSGFSLVSMEKDSDLIAELSQRCADLDRLMGITAKLTVSGDRIALPYELESSIVRIAGEALNNVALHADTDHVGLNLDFTDSEQVVVSIVDNGKGFDSNAKNKQSDGLGFINMSEEVNRWDGSLFVESQVNKGCIITAVFPYPPSEKEEKWNP